MNDSEHFFAIFSAALRQTRQDWLRRDHAAKRKAIIADTPLLDHDPADDRSDQMLLSTDIREAVKSLPEDQRCVTTARLLAGLTRRETADELGLTESRVRTLLAEAKTRLSNILRPYVEQTEI